MADYEGTTTRYTKDTFSRGFAVTDVKHAGGPIYPPFKNQQEKDAAAQWSLDAEKRERAAVLAFKGNKSRETLAVALAAIAETVDAGAGMSEAHLLADALLLEMIDDADVTQAFNAIDKWYD